MAQALKLTKYRNCVKDARNAKFGEGFAERGNTALDKKHFAHMHSQQQPCNLTRNPHGEQVPHLLLKGLSPGITWVLSAPVRKPMRS